MRLTICATGKKVVRKRVYRYTFSAFRSLWNAGSRGRRRAGFTPGLCYPWLVSYVDLMRRFFRDGRAPLGARTLVCAQARAGSEHVLYCGKTNHMKLRAAAPGTHHERETGSLREAFNLRLVPTFHTPSRIVFGVPGKNR